MMIDLKNMKMDSFELWLAKNLCGMLDYSLEDCKVLSRMLVDLDLFISQLKLRYDVVKERVEHE